MALRRRTERLASTNARVDASGRLQLVSWTVRVVAGPDTGTARALAGPMVVGSGETADLRLTDGAVSNHHLALDPRADGVFVKDLGSTNGTLLAGARIETAFVDAQAVISVGRTLLSVQLRTDEQDLDEGPLELEGLVATSAAMRRVFALVEKLAPTETPVILLGETGTGKEGLARAVHARSGRKGPLVVVDCGALAPTLIESELFGHAKGAFTGAVAERPGAFLEAEGGTLFLDEVGDLPLELQPRLLRALEGRQIKRLGEDRHRTVDVRIVAATHRPLEADVKAGRFRSDLYFRLAVAALRVPPLRERREDLPALVKAMLKQLGRETFELSQDLLTRLASYEWPGNVRELRNVVARAVVSDEVSLDNVLNPATSGEPPREPVKRAPIEVPFKEAKEKLVETFTREYLVALSARHEGNVTQMAKASGLARTYLHDLLSRYSLSRPSQKLEEAKQTEEPKPE